MALYEPRTIYRQRQRQLQQTADQQRQAAQQQAEQQRLFDERKQQQQRLGFLPRLLEVTALPGAAAQTALGVRSDTGVSPLGASLARIGGQNVERPNIETVLRQKGVAEGPGVNTPLGRLTARGVAGFAGDILTDPTSFIGPGLFTKGARAAGAVSQAAQTAGDVVPKLPDIGTRLAMSQPESVVERGAAALGQQVNRIPGERTRKAAGAFPNVISPGILQQSELGRLVGRAYQGTVDEGESWVNQVMPLIQGGQPAAQNALANRVIPTLRKKFDDKLAQLPVSIRSNFEFPELGSDMRLARHRVTGETTGVSNKRVTDSPDNWDMLEGPDATRAFLMDAQERVAQVDLTSRLAPMARTIDPEAQLAIRAGRKELIEARKGMQAAMTGVRKGIARPDQVQLLREGFPELYRELTSRGVVNELPSGTAFGKMGREDILAVGKLQRGAARTITETTKYLAQTAREVGVEAERAIGAGRRELSRTGRPQLQFLKDLWFDDATADQLQDILTRTTPAALEALQKPTTFMRTLMTVADFSGAMIQGLGALARDPRAFLKGVQEGGRAFFDSDATSRYLADQASQYTYSKIPVTIVTGGGSEYGASLGKIPVVGGVGERFQRSFFATGDVMRTEWAKSLMRTVDKSTRPNAGDEAAEIIDHATGIFSSRGAGIAPTQRAWEGSMFFFAPRYLRSVLATVGDVMSGGLQRDEALKTLGSMMFLGTAWYNTLSRALGQEPVNDPGDSRFMTVQVGDQRIGIGSTWVSLARLASRLIIDPTTGQVDPGRVLQLDEDNPIVEFWRGRTPPITGSAWDVVQGESFAGYPVTDSVWDFTKYIGTKLLPFSIAGLAEMLVQGDMPTGSQVAAELGSGFTGTRSFPARRQENLDRTAQQQFGQAFDQLSPADKASILNRPEFQSEPPPGKRYESQRQLRGIFGQREQDIQRFAKLVESGTMNKDQFRQRLDEINARVGGELGTVTPSDVKPNDPRELARQDYLALIRQSDEFGQPGFEAAKSFLEIQPAEVRQYIEERKELSNLQLPPESAALMEDLRSARKYLEPYWDIHDQELDRAGMLDDYQAMTPAERADFVDSDRRYSRIRSRITRQKEQWRRRNPKGDAYLADWYGLTPIREHRR